MIDTLDNFLGTYFHTTETKPIIKNYDINLSYLIYDSHIYKFLGTILTPRQRQFLELRYFKGFTMDEIGDVCGVNKSTVSRTLKRARERIKRAQRIKEIL